MTYEKTYEECLGLMVPHRTECEKFPIEAALQELQETRVELMLIDLANNRLFDL